MTGITVTKEQILILKDGLKRNVFNVDIFPEIGMMFESQKDFLKIVEKSDNVTYDIPLYRVLKICVLETLKNSVFPLYKARPALEREAKRSLFLDALQAASVEDDANNEVEQ